MNIRAFPGLLQDRCGAWLAGLREPFVAGALALLHRDITRRWTIDDLGREVGLSRSALADRFIRLIGVPPMHYLASWRMQVATQKLRNTNASLAQVAGGSRKGPYDLCASKDG
jgi:transcriptional regulator GlxA family with amidase domain